MPFQAQHTKESCVRPTSVDRMSPERLLGGAPPLAAGPPSGTARLKPPFMAEPVALIAQALSGAHTQAALRCRLTLLPCYAAVAAGSLDDRAFSGSHRLARPTSAMLVCCHALRQAKLHYRRWYPRAFKRAVSCACSDAAVPPLHDLRLLQQQIAADLSEMQTGALDMHDRTSLVTGAMAHRSSGVSGVRHGGTSVMSYRHKSYRQESYRH